MPDDAPDGQLAGAGGSEGSRQPAASTLPGSWPSTMPWCIAMPSA